MKSTQTSLCPFYPIARRRTVGQDALMPRLTRIEYPGAIHQLMCGEN